MNPLMDSLSKRMMAAWNDGDLHLLDEILAPTYRCHTPDFPEPIDGAAFREWILTLRTAYPDFYAENLAHLAQDDTIVLHWIATGTNTGPLFMMPNPTGKLMATKGVTLHRVAEGKIVESWWYYDRLGYLQQLGVLPTELAAPTT